MGEPSSDKRLDREPERVAWNEWEPGAFARAARERKLVFLDITATWCHWCHVLDATSLSDPRVVRLLNESFVPVRVDTDCRPDVNDRYNQGGWPTTAILLPDGRLLAGATYLPPEALYAELRRCADAFARAGGAVAPDVPGPAGAEDDPAAPGAPAPSREPGPGDVDGVRHAVLSRLDPAFPGFFREPKFLHAEALAFLRDSWAQGADAEAGDALLRILRTMAASEVFDPADGGFFRYATRRDWSAPHYEKLLSDNAEMLSLYAAAYAGSGDPFFLEVAESVLRFLFSRLYDGAAGVFCASLDADEGYYALAADERSRRAPPSADRTVFSEHNARAVSALVAAHGALGERGAVPGGAGTLLDAAQRVAAFLHGRMWSPREGQIRYAEGGAVGAGHLADNVAAALAECDLYDATGGAVHLARAGRLLDWTVRRLYSARVRGFLDRRPGAEEAGGVRSLLVPFAENARAAAALVRHARAAGRTDLLAVGEEVLRGMAGEFDERGFFAAAYGSALLLYRPGRQGVRRDAGPAR